MDFIPIFQGLNETQPAFKMSYFNSWSKRLFMNKFLCFNNVFLEYVLMGCFWKWDVLAVMSIL